MEEALAADPIVKRRAIERAGRDRWTTVAARTAAVYDQLA
jgi:hypothetical protein